MTKSTVKVVHMTSAVSLKSHSDLHIFPRQDMSRHVWRQWCQTAWFLLAILEFHTGREDFHLIVTKNSGLFLIQSYSILELQKHASSTKYCEFTFKSFLYFLVFYSAKYVHEMSLGNIGFIFFIDSLNVKDQKCQKKSV